MSLSPIYAPTSFCRCGYRMDPGTCPECGRANARARRRDPRSASSRALRAARVILLAGVACSVGVGAAIPVVYRTLPVASIRWLQAQPSALRDWGYAIARFRIPKHNGFADRCARAIERENERAAQRLWWSDTWGDSVRLSSSGGFVEHERGGGCTPRNDYYVGRVLEHDDYSVRVRGEDWSGAKSGTEMFLRMDVGGETGLLDSRMLLWTGCVGCQAERALYRPGSSIRARLLNGEGDAGFASVTGPCVGPPERPDARMRWLDIDLQMSCEDDRWTVIGGWIDAGSNDGLYIGRRVFGESDLFAQAEVIWTEAQRAYVLVNNFSDDPGSKTSADVRWRTRCAYHREGESTKRDQHRLRRAFWKSAG